MRQGVRKDYLKGSRRHHRGHSPYPFDRLLASRVGRAWDEVYSELCSEFDSRSWVGYSFRRDLLYHVTTNCYIGAETGAVYSADGWNFRMSNDYYVHPWTGILCYAPSIIRERPAPEVTVIIEDGAKTKNESDRYLEKTEGIWYRHTVTRRWTEKDYWGRDVVRTTWNRSQLGKKDLRANNLRNDRQIHVYDRCENCGADYKCVHRIKAEAERKARQCGW